MGGPEMTEVYEFGCGVEQRNEDCGSRRFGKAQTSGVASLPCLFSNVSEGYAPSLLEVSGELSLVRFRRRILLPLDGESVSPALAPPIDGSLPLVTTSMIAESRETLPRHVWCIGALLHQDGAS